LSNPIGRTIRRQLILEVDLDPQQVVDRVLILNPIEPPQHGAALRFPRGLVCCIQLWSQPIDQRSRVPFGRLRLRLGRHFSFPKSVEHDLPSGSSGLIGEVRSQPIERQVSLRLLAAMTSDAVSVQKRKDLGVKSTSVRLRPRCFGSITGSNQGTSENDHADANPLRSRSPRHPADMQADHLFAPLSFSKRMATIAVESSMARIRNENSRYHATRQPARSNLKTKIDVRRSDELPVKSFSPQSSR
jgi:hypothetical protein